jgi:hypothetical protein
MISRYVAAFSALFAAGSTFAQCGAGESEVFIEVLTDDYGYETYWELLPMGSNCGNGTLFSGGNPAVGCTGGGAQQQAPGGYGNNLSIMEGPFCLQENGQYHIFWADDWGDAGLSFNVWVEGLLTAQFIGTGSGNVFTFTVAPPPLHDLAVTTSRVAHFIHQGQQLRITGELRSMGSETVNSFTLAYSINGGTPVEMNISGVALNTGEFWEFTHDVPWNADAPGMKDVLIWVSGPNGEEDEVPGNNSNLGQVRVLEPVPVLIPLYLAADPVIEVVAGQGQDLLVPRDLDFHPDPDRNELWVVNKDVASTGGSTVRFFGPGEPGMDWLWQRDPNAWHFMNLTTGIAFGDNGNFATCPGIFDANQNGGTPFTGPSLWDADPAVYAQPLFGPLGSHIDMLHVNPESQGIAHDHWNRYWVVDGHIGDITMNDFRNDHGPGNSWHGDAIIRRYADFTITKDPGNHIVSHTILDKNTGWLYVVDHGGQRVLRMDINTGNVAGPGTFGPWETYVEYSMVTGYVWEEIITEGLVQPAGIDIVDHYLLVSDHATGDIVLYDLAISGIPEIGRIATGSPGIMGIKVGPTGHVWYVNATLHQLGRVVPGVGVGVAARQPQATFSVYPVPATDRLHLSPTSGIAPGTPVVLLDLAGRTLRTVVASELLAGFDLRELANGTYVLRVEEHGMLRTARFVVQR